MPALTLSSPRISGEARQKKEKSDVGVAEILFFFLRGGIFSQFDGIALPVRSQGILASFFCFVLFIVFKWERIVFAFLGKQMSFLSLACFSTKNGPLGTQVFESHKFT